MLKKVLGINLLLFAAYVALIVMNSSAAEKGFNIAIGMGVCVVIYVVVNVVTGVVCLVASKAALGKSFLISGAVLAPISFLTWLILLSIFG